MGGGKEGGKRAKKQGKEKENEGDGGGGGMAAKTPPPRPASSSSKGKAGKGLAVVGGVEELRQVVISGEMLEGLERCVFCLGGWWWWLGVVEGLERCVFFFGMMVVVVGGMGVVHEGKGGGEAGGEENRRAMRSVMVFLERAGRVRQEGKQAIYSS